VKTYIHLCVTGQGKEARVHVAFTKVPYIHHVARLNGTCSHLVDGMLSFEATEADYRDLLQALTATKLREHGQWYAKCYWLEEGVIPGWCERRSLTPAVRAIAGSDPYKPRARRRDPQNDPLDAIIEARLAALDGAPATERDPQPEDDDLPV
jgi:hypothetical protein